MRTSEYQRYFDERGPEFAAEPAAARRERVAVSERPLGTLSLAGVAAEQAHLAAMQLLPTEVAPGA